VPDAKHLLDLFVDWTPRAADRQAILSDNPARLYDFR
jgi:predicted TIM-barrel fold metal-dependent hydrolase